MKIACVENCLTDIIIPNKFVMSHTYYVTFSRDLRLYIASKVTKIVEFKSLGASKELKFIFPNEYPFWWYIKNQNLEPMLKAYTLIFIASNGRHIG